MNEQPTLVVTPAAPAEVKAETEGAAGNPAGIAGVHLPACLPAACS